MEHVQGQVVVVDPATMRLTVHVQLMWAPSVRPTDELRQIDVDGKTALAPRGLALGQLRAGDVVEATTSGDAKAGWRATELSVVDVD